MVSARSWGVLSHADTSVKYGASPHRWSVGLLGVQRERVPGMVATPGTFAAGVGAARWFKLWSWLVTKWFFSTTFHEALV